MNVQKSEQLFKRSQRVLVGGVNSPVRAFGSVGGIPRFINSGKGPYICDVDGNRYIDFVGSWGPQIFGHAHPKITHAVEKAVQRGSSFGAPTSQEYELAKTIISHYPSIEMIRFVNSGTEAVQSAIRLARAYTQRENIVKFEGCYHGHTDSLLVKAGSGGTTFGIPTSAGIPNDVIKKTHVLPYNDEKALSIYFKEKGKSLAAVIIEPIAANMGLVLPKLSFLQTLRKLCTQHGTLLIFDEIITGFRVNIGGAQKVFKIHPDITCLGKIIGGGFPVGAYGARLSIMKLVSPLGPVYQAGTLSGNPVAMVAGQAILALLKKKGIYIELKKKTEYLCQKITKLLQSAEYPATINWTTGMFTLFFKKFPVTTYSEAIESDTDIYAHYFHFMLERGFYLPPSQFESNFISLAHIQLHFDKLLIALKEYIYETME